MEKNYAESTGPDTIAIHCDLTTAELVYEGICKIFHEYPGLCPSNWRDEKRNLKNLKEEIEALLPPLPDDKNQLKLFKPEEL